VWAERQVRTAVKPGGGRAAHSSAAVKRSKLAPQMGEAAAYSTYESQHKVLYKFYATHDQSRTAEQICAILDKRRGAEPALSERVFNSMCEKLQEKYGADPREMLSVV
jgi:hypothetical protein